MPHLGGGDSNPVEFRKNGAGSGLRLLVILVSLCIVMFTMSVREGEGGGVFSAARGVVGVITTPVRYLGVAVGAPFRGLANVGANLTADQKTLSDLQKENEELIARNAELEEAEQTATRLQELLDLKDTYSLQSVAARIISGSTDSWARTVTLDKGSASGLAVGMPVAGSNGAIGQIIECGPTSCVVRLITDENSGVSAMIQSSRAQGVLKGSADGRLSLTLISTAQTVSVGDIVVTSGLGGVFPKGLPIGRVISVNKTSGALYYDIDVEAVASTESYEEVLVITSLTEDQQAGADDIAAADAQDAAQVADGSKADDNVGDASDSDSASASGD